MRLTVWKIAAYLKKFIIFSVLDGGEAVASVGLGDSICPVSECFKMKKLASRRFPCRHIQICYVLYM